MGKPVSLDKLQAILAKGDDPPARKPSSKVNTDDRTTTTWFKLLHTFGTCSNPACNDPRPQKIAEGKAMVADVKDITMCRFCFLEGLGLDRTGESS